MTFPSGYTLDADFTQGSIPAGWTFTRGSVATDGFYTDAVGSGYNSFAINVPRLSSAGLLFEASAHGIYLTNSTAPATQVSGALAITSHVLWVIGTGSATVTAGTAAITGGGTATQGNPVNFTTTTTGNVNVTVTGSLNRFQLERVYPGTFFDSSIAFNRAVDVCTIPTGAWYNPAGGTFVVEMSFPYTNLPSFTTSLAAIDDTTVSNRILFGISGAGFPQAIVTTGGVQQFSATLATIATANAPQRYIVRFSAGTNRAAFNGVFSGTEQGGKTMPTVTRLGIGAPGSFASPFYIRRVLYTPVLLSDSDLLDGSSYPPIGRPLATGGGIYSARGIADLPSPQVNIRAIGRGWGAGTLTTGVNLFMQGIPSVSEVGRSTLGVGLPPSGLPVDTTYPTFPGFKSVDTGEYIDRIPRWNRGHEKFVAEVYALVAPGAALKAFNDEMRTLFDVTTAEGVQLDKIGEWIGLSRRIQAPLSGIYFSWDTEGLGWDQGVWLGPFDPVEGLVSLDDPTYRVMLLAKIASNQWDGTLEMARRALQTIVDLAGSDVFLYMQDGQDMTFTIALAGGLPNLLYRSLILDGYIPFKPEGVRMDTFVVSVDGAALFGFDAMTDRIAGWDVGAWGVTV